MEKTDEEPKMSKKKSMAYQLFLGFVATLTTVSPGMSLGFSAVALPAMQAPGSAPPIGEDEASWIASLAAIATPLGCLASGPLLDRLGRRAALLAVNGPCLLGWLLLGATPRDASSAAQIYAGRFLTGVGTGLASVPATVYLTEVADGRLRGVLITWTSAFVSLGIFAVYALGWRLRDDWRAVAWWSAAVPVAAAALVAVALPESPVWLVGRGRRDEAERRLRRARAVPSGAATPDALLAELEDAAAAARRRPARVAPSSFLRPEVAKPLFVMNGFFFFQQFSGLFVVIFYAVDVMEEAGVSFDRYAGAVLVGAARFFVTVPVGYLSQRFGRRWPAVASGAGMTLCMAALAWHLRWPTPARWLPVTALLLYIVTSTVGFLTLPWAMVGEVFPSDVRGLAGAFCTCVAYVFSFTVVKLYPDMLRALGRDGLFFFYGVVSLAGTVFVYLFLPETKGKTLEEIGRLFASPTKGRGAADADDEQRALHDAPKIVVAPVEMKLLSA